MRGKGDSVIKIENASGITPAYAGKSRVLIRLVCGSWDHPRLCGEK